MKIALIAFCLSITGAYAFTTDDLLHPAAHTGSTYIITHAGEVVCKKVTGMGKTPCSIISGAVAMGAGILVEMHQNEDGASHKRGLMEDAAGVLLAVGVIHFDF